MVKMPKCMLHAVRGYKSGKYFESIEHDPYVMTTRSGLTISKVPTSRNGEAPTKIRTVVNSRNNNANTERKRTPVVKYKSLSYLSFVTRFHISLRVPDLELAGVNPRETLQYFEDSPFLYRRSKSISTAPKNPVSDSTTDDNQLSDNDVSDEKDIREIFQDITLSDTEDNFFFTTGFENESTDSFGNFGKSNKADTAEDEHKDISTDAMATERQERENTNIDLSQITLHSIAAAAVNVCDRNNNGTPFPTITSVGHSNNNGEREIGQLSVPLVGVKICSHPTEQIFCCSECGMTFSLLTSYTAHTRMHTRQKNKCQICGKIFTRSWLLKGHMRIHTGERPFDCLHPGCDKAFADKSNLRSHSMIHTVTAKNYNCHKCGRAFAQKRYLHKHMLEVCRI